MAFASRNTPGLTIRMPDGSDWKVFEGKLGEFHYVWSPDGRRLAFRAERIPEEIPRVFALMVAEMESRKVERVTDYLPGLGRPAWRVVGGKIEVYAPTPVGMVRRAYVPVGAAPAGSSLMVYERDGDIWLETEGELPQQLSRGGGYAPALSPDARRVLYSWGDGIFVANVDDPPAQERRPIASGVSPCWSPDGSRIAFSRAVDLGHEDQGQQSDIWILDVTKPDAEPQQLTHTPSEIKFEIAWPAPDKIIYTVRNDGSIRSAKVSL